MSFLVECVTCKVKLRLPESGIGRCPKCKGIVRAEVALQPQAPEPVDLLPEISEEHEAERITLSPIASSPLVPRFAEPDPLPPPLPRPRRRGRDREPEIDIANPPPRPSRALPVTMLAILFIASVITVIGSFWYLIYKARHPGPMRPPVVMPMPRR